MKAIIPCAGFGTRLLPLTRFLPKPMFPLLNRPVIDHIIDRLTDAGVKSLGVNLHHLGDKIRKYLGEENYRGTDLFYSLEEVLLDTGGGLANFAPFIGQDEDFIVHNCDVITPLDLKPVVDAHRKTGALLTMLLVDLPGRNRVLVDGENKVLSLASDREKPLPCGCQLLYGGGIWIYNKEIFNCLPRSGKPYSIIPILKSLIKNKPGSITAYQVPAGTPWTDVGSPGEYLECHRRLLNGNKKRILIADDVKTSQNVSLKGFCSIGPGTVIGSGCLLTDCVTWSGSIIKPGTEIKRAIVTQEMTVRA